MDCLDRIYTRYETVFHLETIQKPLGWDQQVMEHKADLSSCPQGLRKRSQRIS